MKSQIFPSDRGLFKALKEIFHRGRCARRFVLFSNGNNTYAVSEGAEGKSKSVAYYGGYSTGGPSRASDGDLGDFLKNHLDDYGQLALILSMLDGNKELQRKLSNVLHKSFVAEIPIDKQNKYHELIGGGVDCGR